MTAPASTRAPPERSRDAATAPPARDDPAAPRFTLDGDNALEQHLERTCARIAAGLRGLLPARRLQAVMLGGGYGRGEGGVWRTPEGDRPYNDLEFYVFLRGNRHLDDRRYGRALHVLGEILTPQAGVDVEFRIAALGDLAASRVTMFSYDLVRGHRWLVGDEPLLHACAHHREATGIPPAEATRLLMNRCSGLLFAAERLRRSAFTPADADFVARNIAKAQLGAGDAVLTACAQYHWSVRERHRLLRRIVRGENGDWFERIGRHHATGLEFKLHPTRSTAAREELAALHAEVADLCRETWLWVEHRRLHTPFRSVCEYAASPATKCPETSVAHNVLLNLKVLGAGAVAHGRLSRHPRERVLNTLPVLLWQPDALSSPSARAHLRRELLADTTDPAGLIAAYRSIWERVN